MLGLLRIYEAQGGSNHLLVLDRKKRKKKRRLYLANAWTKKSSILMVSNWIILPQTGHDGFGWLMQVENWSKKVWASKQVTWSQVSALTGSDILFMPRSNMASQANDNPLQSKPNWMSILRLGPKLTGPENWLIGKHDYLNFFVVIVCHQLVLDGLINVFKLFHT